MKNVFRFLFVFSLFIYQNANSQNGWIQQSNNSTSTLYVVKMLDQNTGWSAGIGGKVIRTTNSGINWILQQTGFTKNIYDFEIVSADTSYLSGDSGLIARTTNAGINWTIQNSGTSTFIKTIFFLNATTGFACSWTKFLKTTNAGSNWIPVGFVDSIVQFFQVDFLDSGLGWLITTVPSGTGSPDPKIRIYKTIDNGITWVSLYDFDKFDYFTTGFFLNSQNGWISIRENLTSASVLFNTQNGGVNWSYGNIGTDDNHPISSVFFVNLNKGWLVNQDRYIHYTSNGGLNWNVQYTGVPFATFYSNYFVDSLTGWTVGNGGKIFKTTNGGLTSLSNSNSEIPDQYYLQQNYPNPFNPKTNLEFGISDLGFVSLKIYDVLGKEVVTLVNEKKTPGQYKVEFDGSDFPSGVFFYRLEVDGNVIETKRMVLIR